MKMFVLVIILTSCLLGCFGQICFKLGVEKIKNTRNIEKGYIGLIVTTMSTWIPIGIVLYVVSLGFWLLALKLAPLSTVYPFLSLNLVVLTIYGATFHDEPISSMKLIGITLILVGVILVGRTLKG
jgi:multidrug transporter EmrE-like cation transporter